MPSSPGNFLLLRKQNGQPGQGTARYQRSLCQPDGGTNHRIKHPRRHAARRPVCQPHIDHVPLTASRAKSFVRFPKKRMKWIENLGKQTKTRIVERGCLSEATSPIRQNTAP